MILKTGEIKTNNFYENNVTSTYTKVGSPTINDGVFSNLDNSNYINLPFFDFKDKVFSIKVTVNFTENDLIQSRAAIIGQGGVDYKIMTLASESGHPRLWYGTTGTGWSTNVLYNNVTFKANQDYDCEYIVDKTNAVLKIDGAFIHKASYSGITYDIGTNVIRFGNTVDLTTWKLEGSVKNIIVTLDNKIVWSSLDSYLLNENSKIGKKFISSTNFYES